MSTNAHQIDIDSMEGVAHVIRSGKEAASIFVDIENGFRKGEPGKLEFNIIHLKIVGTLGCYEGSINAEKHEDWRQILADMPADRFLEAFASDRSEAPIDIEATLKAAEAFIEEKHASKVIDRTEGKEAMEFLMVARGMPRASSREPSRKSPRRSRPSPASRGALRAHPSRSVPSWRRCGSPSATP
jgi:hypothetical protein